MPAGTLKYKLGHVTAVSPAYTGTANTSIKYIVLIYQSASIAITIKLSNIQIEKSATETSFVPFYESQTDIYLNAPLTKVEIPSVASFQDILNYSSGGGIVTRKNTFVDVTNDGVAFAKHADYDHIFYKTLSTNKAATYALMSNYYAAYTGTALPTLQNLPNNSACFIANYNSVLYIRDDRFSTAEDFNAWNATLTSNPILVCIPIPIPTSQAVTADPISLAAGSNTINALTSIAPSNIDVTYYQNPTGVINELKQAIINFGGNI